MTDARRLAVLISGRGSNLKAVIDAIAGGGLEATIAVVISNQAEAPGLDHADAAGIETLVLSHQAFATREDYDRAMVKELQDRQVTLGDELQRPARRLPARHARRGQGRRTGGQKTATLHCPLHCIARVASLGKPD